MSLVNVFIYSWGRNKNGELATSSFQECLRPTPIHLINTSPSQIASGGKHTLLLTENDNKILSCGSAEFGVLGNEVASKMKSHNTLSPIQTFEDEEITSISSAEFHSLCLTKDGFVCSWGGTLHSKLGQDNPTGIPMIIKSLSLKKVVQISCGDYHSAIITSENELYTWYYWQAIGAALIQKRADVREDYRDILYEHADRLLKTQYRNRVVETMVCVCEEEELERWLRLCPLNATFHRRSCMALWCAANEQYDLLSVQQGLALLENLAVELDRRYPDSNGPAQKEQFHRAIMRLIRHLGEDGEVPDAWRWFYSYKQLVLSACLFAQGRAQEGWVEFEEAIERCKQAYASREKYFSLGGVLFFDLRVNQNWTYAIDQQGQQHALHDIAQYSHGDALHFAMLLRNSKYVWFQTARQDERFCKAVAWFEQLCEQQKNQ